MKILFMGTPELAAVILTRIAAEHEVVCVVTNPDRPQGRKGTPQPSAVKARALELGLPVHTCSRLKNEEETAFVCGLDADLIVVAAFGQIVPPQVLAHPRYGCVNVHTSLLPAYRGAAPIQWAILDGCAATGVTIMQMDEGLDTGDILAQKEISIGPEITAEELTMELADEGAGLLLDTIRQIEAGTVRRTPQPECSTTAYAKMITKDMGKNAWEESADTILRKIRAFTPWPGTATTMNGLSLKIFKAKEGPLHKGAAPGLVKTDGAVLMAAAGDRYLILEEVQLAGKKKMAAADFLRGSRIAPGTVLGK